VDKRAQPANAKSCSSAICSQSESFTRRKESRRSEKDFADAPVRVSFLRELNEFASFRDARLAQIRNP
jgi:hypothetical protein